MRASTASVCRLGMTIPGADRSTVLPAVAHSAYDCVSPAGHERDKYQPQAMEAVGAQAHSQDMHPPQRKARMQLSVGAV